MQRTAPITEPAAEPNADAPKSPADPRRTPAMRQYDRFKKQHPECVLFFRMGDFYEMFDDDAVLVHKALGITLTERTAGVPMAGVPYHAAENYIRRLIEQGHRVAVCDQIQDPAEAKGVVDRAVTRVLTPGTLVDETMLNEAAANYIAAVAFTEPGDDAAAVLAMAELSTGQFTLHDLPAGRVADEVARLAPSELLYVETADGNTPPRVERIEQLITVALTPRPAWTFRPRDAGDLVRNHFGVQTLAGFGLDDDHHTVGPAGALLRYLHETQASSEQNAAALDHIRPPKLVRADQGMIVDATSLASLEIERTMRTGQTSGSLLSVLQRCRTPMGKRLLRQWLCFPLSDLDAISARQKAVGALLADERLSIDLAGKIDGVQDVARIASRVSMRRATPRDLVALGRSVSVLDDVRQLIEPVEALSEHCRTFGRLIETLAPLAETVTARCVDDPPAHLREGGLFRDGVDSELDEARLLQRDASDWLARYQKQLIDQTDIPSLKVGYNKVFGYYIEITHAHRDKITPKILESFSRKQTLKNAERYITPELKEFEEKVTTAETRAIEREKALFDQLCAEAAGRSAELHEYAGLIAELDVLLCFADVAQRYGYVRPDVVDAPVLDIQQGRHVVLDRTLGEGFVPNDCVLGRAGQGESGTGGQPETDADDCPGDESAGASTLALITGPNMAGKSTYIRQVAVIVLLAHTGCYVPAESATIGLTDRLFTRIGASDELHAGQSTFMVEMTETANILHHATERSLVILDEIGRGTSTLDGLSLAWAIAETLAQKRSRTLFATHYHELTSLAENDPAITNLHVAVREWGEQIIFLYRILPGRADRSYGIHVAKIAGLPDATVKRAQSLLDTLAVQTEQTGHDAQRAHRSPEPAASQMSLFTEYVHHPVIDDLRQIDINALTPIAAFDVLRQLRERLDGEA